MWLIVPTPSRETVSRSWNLTPEVEGEGTSNARSATMDEFELK
jgi:hypothetical protein